MGACSSKPKTTDFEGSTEPAKNAKDMVVDRNTDAALVSQENEPTKGNDGAADAGKETEQGTRELIAHKDEAPVVKESSSKAEGASSTVEGELCAVDGGAGDGAVKKVGENVPDAQKVDASDGIAEEDKEVNDMTSGEGGNVGGDQGKLFEDKAVVLNESSNSDVDKGGAYTDKGLAAGEERAHDSSDVADTNTADESWKLQAAQEARGIGSPIIGVVQASEPINVDDVSADSVGLETPETTTPIDFKVSESLDEASLTGQHRGEDVVSSGKEVANLSSGSPQEAPKEKEEIMYDDLNSSHPSVNDGVGQKSEVDDTNRVEEVPLASAYLQGEQTVEETAKPYTTSDSQIDPEEKTSLPQEESVPVESSREPQTSVIENEGDSVALDEPELEAPKVLENVEEGTHLKPTAEMKAAGEGQAEGMVDESNESNVLLQNFKAEDVKPEAASENVKPEAASTLANAEPTVEASPQIDRDKTDKPQIQAMMNGEKVEDVDAGKEETVEQEKKTTAEGDLAYEDASDKPLKLEPSTEAGDRAA